MENGLPPGAFAGADELMDLEEFGELADDGWIFETADWDFPTEKMVPAETDVPEAEKPKRNPDHEEARKKRRMQINRQSAQRSRLKKIQYKENLENKVTTLQVGISAIKSRLSHFDEQRMMWELRNDALRQQIATVAQEKLIKEAQFKALQKEKKVLLQLKSLQIRRQGQPSIVNGGFGRQARRKNVGYLGI